MKKLVPNMLGTYGPWAAEYVEARKRSLSFLHSKWSRVEEWREKAREKVLSLLNPPYPTGVPENRAEVTRRYTYRQLEIEEITWKLPYGPPTEAIFMKPADTSGPLPGILALHDHGAVKYFGKRKIIRTSDHTHPYILEHQGTYYGGVGWADELARRGYGVLIHDVFPFESRKIRASELPGHVVKRMMAQAEDIEELKPEDLEDDGIVNKYDVPEGEPTEAIISYNAFASRHEDIIAKSLFCAGLTWPGVFVREDQWALDYLCSRPDIDADRVGCCGLSGGGLRTNYLAGLDDRIRCAVSVGFMTTWRDFLFNSCYTHTWMIYIPLLANSMDHPEILGMRAPLPTLVLSTDNDPLFDLAEVKRAARILSDIFEKAGSPATMCFSLYPGPHKFDLPMQKEAFEWLDRWLK